MATLEIEPDPSLDETLCIACGRSAALCGCPPHVRAAAALQAEHTGLRRLVHEALARAHAQPGWDGLRAAAALAAAGPRWIWGAALRAIWRRGS